MSELKLNWVESLLVCRSFGMNLMTIKSSEEFQYLDEILRVLLDDHHYIGGSNLGSKSWYWVSDGLEISMKPEEWHNGKPDGQDQGEFCADFHDPYKREIGRAHV